MTLPKSKMMVCMQAGDVSLLWRDANIPKRNRSVVALKHERSGWRFLIGKATWRRAVHLDVLVDYLIVKDDFQKLGFAHAFAVFELWRLKVDHEFLPFAGLLAGVDLRGGRGIKPAHVARADFLLAVTVENLHFVFAHDVDAGIGSLGNHKLDFDMAVAKLLLGVDVGAAALGVIHHFRH